MRALLAGIGIQCAAAVAAAYVITNALARGGGSLEMGEMRIVLLITISRNTFVLKEGCINFEVNTTQTPSVDSECRKVILNIGSTYL